MNLGNKNSSKNFDACPYGLRLLKVSASMAVNVGSLLIISICTWGEHPIAKAPLAAYSRQMIQRSGLPTDFTRNPCEL